MYEALRDAIDESPEDWDRRLILADFCEESRDLLEAEFWRWTAKEHKRARKSENNYIPYQWYNISSNNNDVDPESDIPKELYKTLKTPEADYWTYKLYKTNREADDDLLQAYKKTEFTQVIEHEAS